MWGRVVLKFGSRKEVQPGFGVVGAKDAEVRFYLLISAFSLSVSLRVIGGGEFDIVLEEFS